MTSGTKKSWIISLSISRQWLMFVFGNFTSETNIFEGFQRWSALLLRDPQSCVHLEKNRVERQSRRQKSNRRLPCKENRVRERGWRSDGLQAVGGCTLKGSSPRSGWLQSVISAELWAERAELAQLTSKRTREQRENICSQPSALGLLSLPFFFADNFHVVNLSGLRS